MSQHFDVVVIGMQRAGLIAAALLAKRGARVLLVDNGESCATYRRKGLRLPLVPALVPVLNRVPHARRVIDELALGPQLRTTLVPMTPSFQAVLPGHRVDIVADREATISELGLEFPDLAGPVRVFFQKLESLDQQLAEILSEDPPLPPATTREWLRSRTVVNRAARFAGSLWEEDLFSDIPADHPLRQVLLAPLSFFGHLPARSPTVFQAVRLLARYFDGAVAYPDRVGGLTTLLLDAGRDAGVEVHRGAVVGSLLLAGKRLARMTVEDDRMTYSANLFVANTIGPFGDLLPPGRQHARFTADQQAVRPVASLLTLNLVVHKRALPVGMGPAVFLLDGRRQPRGEQPEDPPVFLRRYPAQRFGTEAGTRTLCKGEEEDLCVLSAACPAPRADVQRSPERLAALKALLFERVRRAVPFVNEHLVDRSLAMDTAGWDIQAQNRRVDPLGVHPFFEHHTHPMLGVGGRPSRTCLKNVLHCGPDVVPGLGIEGDFITGLAAARAAGLLAGGRWQPR